MSTPNQPKNKTLVSAHKDDGGIQFEYDLAPFALTEDAVSRRKKETAPMVALANGAGIGMHDNTTEIGENENIVAEDGLKPEDFMWVEEVDTGEDDLTKKVEKKDKEDSVIDHLLDEYKQMAHVDAPKAADIDDENRPGTIPAMLDTVPWKKCLKIKSPSLRLHQEILNFCKCLEPTSEEEKARKNALSRIENAVRSIWHDARVEVFGSFATGMYLPTSDIDAVILDSGCVDVKQGLKALATLLSRKGISVDLQVILKARVPIIKFEDKESGYKFDISFDVANGPEAASNVRNMIQNMPAMKPLVMILKVFLQQRELNEVYSGGIGSYALLVVVANFLQTHTSRFQSHKSESNLGELLMDFFRLHGRALQHGTVGVSCSKGGRFFKKKALEFFNEERPYLLAVEDPNDSSNDLGKNSYNASRVRMAYDHAYSRLAAPVKPGDSLLARVLRLDAILFGRFDGIEIQEIRRTKDSWRKSSQMKVKNDDQRAVNKKWASAKSRSKGGNNVHRNQRQRKRRRERSDSEHDF